MTTEGAMGEYRLRLSDDREFGPVPMETILQWARQGRVPRDVQLISQDDGVEYSVLDMPELARIVQAPPTESTGLRHPLPSSPSALIPRANPHALIGYYLAVASILLVFLAPVAIVLGFIGLRKVKKNPAIKGTTHAWVAIIGGTLVIFGYVAIFSIPTLMRSY